MKENKALKKILSGAIMLALLTGCGSTGNGEGTSDSTTASTDSAQTSASESETTTTAASSEDTTTSASTSAEESSDTTPSAPPAANLEYSDKVGTQYQQTGENGILVVDYKGHYMGLMGCWGTQGCCEDYANSVNYFADNLSGVNVYSMIVPTSIEFYQPDGLSGFTASQKEKIEFVNNALSSKVTPIDVYSALEKHTDELIYSRTDHHWQPLGAYYAAEVFCNKLGLDFAPLSDYEEVTMGGYVGSMYNYSLDANLKNDPEDFTMYIPSTNTETTYYDESFANGTDGDLFVSPSGASYYCSFLGTDMEIAEIENADCKNGKTLVIFKESYGNALVPFLTGSYENIYVCDIRYFNINAIDFCKEVGATDVLFAVCTFTPAGSNGSLVSTIAKQ